jgi:hypothetical protein
MTKLLQACVRERLVSTLDASILALDAPGWFGASGLLGAGQAAQQRRDSATSLQIADQQGGQRAAEWPAICIDGYCSVIWQAITRGCIGSRVRATALWRAGTTPVLHRDGQTRVAYEPHLQSHTSSAPRYLRPPKERDDLLARPGQVSSKEPNSGSTGSPPG